MTKSINTQVRTREPFVPEHLADEFSRLLATGDYYSAVVFLAKNDKEYNSKNKIEKENGGTNDLASEAIQQKVCGLCGSNIFVEGADYGFCEIVFCSLECQDFFLRKRGTAMMEKERPEEMRSWKKMMDKIYAKERYPRSHE